MEVYRLAREMHASPLSGKGAALKGGRWNSIGVELIYTAENRSLAMAEVVVHLTLATLPPDYVMVTIHIPGDIEIARLTGPELPPDWQIFPHPVTTQKFGDDFVTKNEYCALSVPSAVTQGDHNILINPAHRDFPKINILSIERFPFDRRIFKGL